jgi:hypothetical protein
MKELTDKYDVSEKFVKKDGLVWVFHVGLGVGGTTIASGSLVHTSHSWTSHLLTSSFSLGVSSLFCRVCETCRLMIPQL